LHRVWRDL